MALTERAPLSRQRIAESALALIDARGLDQLSMRKLGAELGVEAMSLYNHVSNKQDLLDAVADVLYVQVIEEYGSPVGPWRQRAEHMAASYVAVAVTHPNAFSLLLDRPPVSEAGLRFMDRVIDIFDDVTDDMRVAALAFSVVANWVVGTLIQQISDDGTVTPPEADGYERVQAFREAMLQSVSPVERFAEGLAAVLDGIEIRYFGDSR